MFGVCALLASCHDGTSAAPPSSSAEPATTTAEPTTTTPPPATTTTTPSAPAPPPVKTTTPAAPPPPQSGGRSCPAAPAYPTTECTGVPPGTKLAVVDGDLNASTPGQVIDARHVTGNLNVLADNVVIRNSQIDGFVTNTQGQHPYTITDSTVGADSGCNLETGVGEARFTATRVYIHGHGDGYGVAGDHVLIQDSFVHLCGTPEAHSDGVQGYQGGVDVVIRHNTLDQRDVPMSGQTAPVFISDGSKDAVVQDNLLLGGSETIRVNNGGGHYVVQGNRVVDGSWIYGPVASACGAIGVWSDNRLVTIDRNYRVTSLGATLPCSG
ncbi:hypothetical protein F0L68_18270 [Solihabitans fulvus]|uniref:Right handed beta helix region n=1 Tax=Solihabitans fulvus TaxID=1892852 RepID=A0A5B2XDC2_9PSEU|nr:hypothetical protein [Solihabitans fulvus]KAA2261174.1 hypothetical protein F0L68_18270 [Solihabitans fulvus]